MRTETLGQRAVKADIINQPQPSNVPSQGRVEKRVNKAPNLSFTGFDASGQGKYGVLWELSTEKARLLFWLVDRSDRLRNDSDKRSYL
jgi:hypothetical protein